MIIAINYADEKYRNAQRLNSKTACRGGGCNEALEYSEHDIDLQFKQKNKKLWESKRGAGYWIWKPYIISKTMDYIQDGDYLVYADSGATYINKIQYIIDAMEKQKTDIGVFLLTHREKLYSKRDALILMECDKEEYIESPQRLATFIILKKTQKSMQFVKEYLEWVQDPRIVSDDENVMGLPNYPEFIDNRHDQTVLSLLSKKWGISAFRDPSQYGNNTEKFSQEVIERSSFPQIFDHHRNGSITTNYIIYKYKLNKLVPDRVRWYYKKFKSIIIR